MVIAVVGAGGKTTRIKKLAKKYVTEGKNVFITTTTHMYKEADTVLYDGTNEADILKHLEEDRVCMAGVCAKEGKISSLPEEVYNRISEKADVTLVEADGAKHMLIKYPSESEPVIPNNADRVDIVMNLDAIGKSFEASAHRIELVCSKLGVLREDIVTAEHIEKLIHQGYIEKIKSKGISVNICPAGAESLYLRAVAACLKYAIPVNKIKKEWFDTEPVLFICGAGHVGKEVAHLAKRLGFYTIIADDREVFANKAAVPDADEIICDSFENISSHIPDYENMYYVVATRGHSYDFMCVNEIMKKKFTYLGMIGSRPKVKYTVEKLKENGYSSDEIARVCAPIGLAIASQTPAEIAVSIMAQIIQYKNSKSMPGATRQMAEERKAGILAIIISKRGSSPRDVGTMMLFSESNTIGTIGGGILEKYVSMHAAKMLQNNENACIKGYNLSNDENADEGMVCGGYNEVLFLHIGPAEGGIL